MTDQNTIERAINRCDLRNESSRQHRDLLQMLLACMYAVETHSTPANRDDMHAALRALRTFETAHHLPYSL